MALIPKFHVVAAERPVAASQTIIMGQIVSLNASGNVVIQGANVSSGHESVPYGIAGDTKSTSNSYMPGIAHGWQNRVSDYNDETKASGKMTVYHSGGEFATDQFAANVAGLTVPMVPLYARSGVLDTIGEGDGTAVIVGYLLQVASSYPSGVPGTDTTKQGGVAVNGDMALSGQLTVDGTGYNTYIEFKLMI